MPIARDDSNQFVAGSDLAVVAATVVVHAAAWSNAKGFISGNLTGSLSSFSIWMLPLRLPPP